MENVRIKTGPIYDGYCFDKVENVTFTINHPLRREIVLTFDKPWEGFASTYHSVLFNPENHLYYLYYRGMPTADDDNPAVSTCVAISTDGVRFTRPNLGICAWDGSTQNNIIFSGDPTVCHNFAPFYDTNPSCPPSERFKAVAGYSAGGLYVYAGEDGFHFRRLTDKPVLVDGAFDSLNTAFFDAENGVYRVYSRYFDGQGVRAIQSAVSADFLHWSQPVPNRYPENPGAAQQLYTNSSRPMPGSPYILVSIPMRFHPDRKKVAAYTEDGISDCVLMFSRNGTDWKLPFVQPWIYPGIDERLWTQRNFIVSAGMAETGDDVSVYVDEHYMWDDNHLTRYTVPRGRFASAYAENGLLVTKPFTAAGDTFTLNYMTSAYGTLTISLLDENGATLPYEAKALYGNMLDEQVTFAGIAGKRVRLSFRLEDAHLFAVGGMTMA